jgi:hypothetical protein
MIQTNPVWDAKNALLAKKPIYVFAISGEARVYSTHDLAAEGIAGAPEFKAWLKTPRGATQTIDVLNGSSSIGELECEVVDVGGAVRELVGGTTLEGRTGTLLVGYPVMDYLDFVALHTYQIYKITPSRNYTSWIFRSRDRQLAAKRTIYIHPENGLEIEESNPWVVMGTPAEIIQAVWLAGLNRPVAEVDRAAMLALDAGSEGLHKTVRPFFFVLTEAFEAKQFLEREIFKTTGVYPVVDNFGRLSVRAPRPAAAGPASVFTFNQDNITVLPEIDRMPVMNEIVFRIDHTDGEFQDELIFIDATSVSTYGRAGQHVIESKGLRTGFGAQWWCEEVAARLFRRFAGTPTSLRGGAPLVRIEAFLLSLPVWVGDYVLVSHPKMPDLTTGALGVTDRLYEVIDREPDFARGRMRYKLLDTGLTGLQAARKFSPSDRDFINDASEVYRSQQRKTLKNEEGKTVGIVSDPVPVFTLGADDPFDLRALVSIVEYARAAHAEGRIERVKLLAMEERLREFELYAESH